MVRVLCLVLILYLGMRSDKCRAWRALLLDLLWHVSISVSGHVPRSGPWGGGLVEVAGRGRAGANAGWLAWTILAHPDLDGGLLGVHQRVLGRRLLGKLELGRRLLGYLDLWV